MNKKHSVSLRKIINNDKSLIVVVLILAVIIWTAASLNIGTNESKTITVDVPISLSDELSKQVGMKYYTLQDTVELNITVDGAKYIVGQVSEKDLNIKFDTSNVNRAGEQSIPILVTNKSKSKDFTVTNVYPSSIDAYFDVNESKTFNIKLKYDDEAIADGYVFGTPALSEDKVVISGPTTYVDKIKEVGVNLDFEGNEALTEPVNTTCKLQLKGSGIEQGYLSLTSKSDSSFELNEIAVTLPVLKVTTLPVSVDFENEPADLTSDEFSVVYSDKTVKAGVLESADVKSAVVGKIDFKELDIGKNSFEFDLDDADGFTVLDDSVKSVKVKVNISDKFEKKVVAIDKNAIKIIGGNGDERIKSLSKTTLIVIAPKDEKISASDISIKCDISDKKDNKTYELEFSVKNKKAWVYSTYTAYVD